MMSGGSKMLPGASTINFDKVTKESIISESYESHETRGQVQGQRPPAKGPEVCEGPP